MTDQEIRDTVRQMMTDWNAAAPAQRDGALAAAAIHTSGPARPGCTCGHCIYACFYKQNSAEQ